MSRYSIWTLIREAVRDHRGWQPAWRDAAAKPSYDVVIVGGGGHGLATAYYLAKEHGLTNVAVLERRHVGSGNVGRNTTIIRSNYLLTANTAFYEWSLKLWEGLEQEIHYNAMVSQRGVLNLFHSDAQRDAYARRGNAMRIDGVDAELLDREAVRRMVPYLDYDNARFPIRGGLLQRRGGTVRHDAVAWGYARAADRLGVDIVQDCEVTGINTAQGRVVGVETTRGPIAANRVGLAVAGHSSRLAAMAGLRLPIESHVLQAFVTEGIKPLIDTVVTFGAGHFYISQSDKGGARVRRRHRRLQLLCPARRACDRRARLRGGDGADADARTAARPAKLGGVMDMSMDGSPIIDRTPIEGLFLNAGWCYGGFKATPASGWCFAYTIARNEPHPLNAVFRLDRFATGHIIDEKGQGPMPNLH